jgi:hypothetical protein
MAGRPRGQAAGAPARPARVSVRHQRGLSAKCCRLAQPRLTRRRGRRTGAATTTGQRGARPGPSLAAVELPGRRWQVSERPFDKTCAARLRTDSRAGRDWITTRRTPISCRATIAWAAGRLHAERRRTCSARAGEPRSTPERAYFMTWPEATLACAAREVTLYLALTSLRRPVVFSQVSSLACRASATGPCSGSGPGMHDDHGPPPRTAEPVAEIPPGCLHDEGHRLSWPPRNACRRLRAGCCGSQRHRCRTPRSASFEPAHRSPSSACV